MARSCSSNARSVEEDSGAPRGRCSNRHALLRAARPRKGPLGNQPPRNRLATPKQMGLARAP
eukprot:7957797-Alexandrium_andersonii.AAC.1